MTGRAAGPLEGLRILDITHVLAGAYCAQLLADMGADVVKIERPTGEDFRHGIGSFVPFDAVNRNKRSLAIDLRNPAGASAVRRMARNADVLVENFRPGALDRLGLGYDELAVDNPGLVYCSISGFGSTGPYRDRGGFDLVAQGMSGVMSITGEPGRPPVKCGVPIGDLNAAMFGAQGILAATIHRLRTGEGQRVDTSLLEGAIAYTVWESAEWFALERVPQPTGSAHRLSAPYEAFITADGHLTLGAANQATWERLCTAVDRSDLLADPRFARPATRLAHRGTLHAELAPIFASRNTDEWLDRLDAAGVPCGPIYTVDQVSADPHIQEREMIVELDDGEGAITRHIGVPVKLSRTPAAVARRAPQLGEHNAEVLADYGFTRDEINTLRDSGAIAAVATQVSE